jgi:hypothetical protein
MKCLLFLLDFNQTRNTLTASLLKFQIWNFTKIRMVWVALLHVERGTEDKQKFLVASRNFC